MSCCHQSKTWYQSPLPLICISITAIVLLSPFYKITAPIFHHYIEFVTLTWWPMLIGLVIGGLIDHYIPRSYIEFWLRSNNKRSLLRAIIAGICLSACCHGILAIAMQLHKKGASAPTIITLLTAAPWANLPMTILLFRFFGWQASLIVIGAIIIAFITGFIYQKLDHYHRIEPHPSPATSDTHFSPWQDIRSRWQTSKFTYQSFKKDGPSIINSTLEISNTILWWFGIAIAVAAIISAYVPSHFFMTYMSKTPIGMANTLLAATIIEVCSEGTSVLAFELYQQTQALGNVFLFLLAGVATDYTEIGLIWKTMGRRTALWLPTISVPLIFIGGWIINSLSF